jgi:hypothetical protein
MLVLPIMLPLLLDHAIEVALETFWKNASP